MQPTKRESEVLKRLCNGYTIKEIAHELYLSPHTVITHCKNLRIKLKAKNCTHMVAVAITEGIISMK